MEMFEPYRSDRRRGRRVFHVSRAGEIDLPAVARLSVAREGGDYQQALGGLQEYLEGDHAQLFVAMAGAELVGFGKSRVFAEPGLQYPGWYLSGVIVTPAWRGCGIGSALTRRRIAALREITDVIYYCVNSANRVSIELHAHFGFKLLAEPFALPDMLFASGHGCLYALPTGTPQALPSRFPGTHRQRTP